MASAVAAGPPPPAATQARGKRRRSAAPPVQWRGRPQRPSGALGGWRGAAGFGILRPFVESETRFRLHPGINDPSLWVAYWAQYGALSRQARVAVTMDVAAAREKGEADAGADDADGHGRSVFKQALSLVPPRLPLVCTLCHAECTTLTLPNFLSGRASARCDCSVRPIHCNVQGRRALVAALAPSGWTPRLAEAEWDDAHTVRSRLWDVLDLRCLDCGHEHAIASIGACVKAKTKQPCLCRLDLLKHVVSLTPQAPSWRGLARMLTNAGLRALAPRSAAEWTAHAEAHLVHSNALLNVPMTVGCAHCQGSEGRQMPLDVLRRALRTNPSSVCACACPRVPVGEGVDPDGGGGGGGAQVEDTKVEEAKDDKDDEDEEAQSGSDDAEWAELDDDEEGEGSPPQHAPVATSPAASPEWQL